MEALQQQIRDTCFVKPKVPDSKFLETCRKYDPNFAPVSSEKERETRAALSKQVQEKMVACIPRELIILHPDLKIPDGKSIDRHHRILFRGRTLEEQQQLADLVTSGNKRALADLLHERLLSKKDALLALLDMDDAQLVENYFKYKDEIDLVIDMEPYRNDCEFSPTQQTLYNELFSKQSALAYIGRRMDMIANPYYANFHCENLEMSYENSQNFNADLIGLAQEYGETLAGFNDIRLGGPTHELTTDYSGLRGFALTVLEQDLTNLLQPFGATKARACTWAGANGKMGSFEKLIDTLNSHELIFVDIPGIGIKALHNTHSGFQNCTPEVATPEVVHQHMLRAAENGTKHADAANPFFLSVFTGSRQYNQMAAQYKAVKEMLKTRTFPLSAEDSLKIEELQKSAKTYLDYKRDQGLQEVNGTLIGRTANERKRLAAAQEALDLNFMFQYQRDPAAASNILQSQQKQKDAKINQMLNKPVAPTVVAPAPEYKPEELSSSTAEELKAKIQPYKNISSCLASDAGDAMVRLHNNMSGTVDQLIKLPLTNVPIKESTAKNFRTLMANVVLFDYVLRERTANGQTQKDGPITAGTVEKALNNRLISSSALANSPEFKEAIGKVTPARVEAFLKNDESRNKKFDTIVQNLVSPVKANTMGNQPVQQQPQAEIDPAKAAPKPMVNGNPFG